jgi:hypothetical protein
VENLPNIDEKWKKWTGGDWAQVEWKTHSSTTIDPDVAFKSDNGVLFMVKSRGKQGGYIDPLSAINEEEVLFKRGSRFRVVGFAEAKTRGESGGHKRILLLEEVEEPPPIPREQTKPEKFKAGDLWNQFEMSHDEFKGAA